VPLVNENDPRPPYVQVADHLREAIKAGELQTGQKLPAHKHLAEDYGVAPMTINNAIRILRDQGFLVSSHGRGVFVSNTLPATEHQEHSPEFLEIMKHLDAMRDALSAVEQRLAQVEAIVKPEEQRGKRPRRSAE
jgi:GntR family transcriptional regulator